MPGERCSDVLIAGGGLAGLCLGIQLKRAEPSLSVQVVERRTPPMPDAAFKVGESSVEIGSLYFERTLGVADLLSSHIPKFGLRFFLPRLDNRDVTARLECGPSRFFTVPSYQIDRGRFENQLAERARELGVTLRTGSRVESLELSAGDGPHRVHLADGRALEGRWLVDASGRASLLKRTLRLRKANRHRVNAVWFRLDRVIDVDRWSDSAAWSGRVEQPRRLSTNHFMGAGYWVWVIPLSGDRTSIGIVAEDSLHPFERLHTATDALLWLAHHEPQLAEVVGSEPRMDFLVMKNFSHACRRVIDAERRWAITGEAGYFADPLYSPGSDFIALSNELVGDLIVRDKRGDAVESRARVHERTYVGFYRAMMSIYEQQYPILGSPRAMTVKILWDFAMYWSGIALVYSQGAVTDPELMKQVRPKLQQLASLGLSQQRFLREWAATDPSSPSGFVNYSELSFLAKLNESLLHPPDFAWLLHQLERNLQLVRELDLEIRARVAKLRGEPVSADSDHLREVFEVLSRADGAADRRVESPAPPLR